MKLSSSLFLGLVSLATIITALPTSYPSLANRRNQTPTPHYLKPIDDPPTKDVAGPAITKRGRGAKAGAAIEAAIAAAIAGSHRTERPESIPDDGSTEEAAGAAVAKRGRGGRGHRVKVWGAKGDAAAAAMASAS